MEKATRDFYDKRGEVLVKNLQKRHFEAYYCDTMVLPYINMNLPWVYISSHS